MSEKYKIWDQNKLYFLTLTVKEWIDIFDDDSYKLILIDSLRYCQQEKGLEIFGYCIMSTHVHLLARVKENYTLSGLLRDFKKYTSKAILKRISNEAETEKRSLRDKFENTKESRQPGKENFTLWKEGNHPIEITSNKFFDEKLDYIHNNPVNAFLVRCPEDYLFSSARNYAGLYNHLEIVLEIVKLRTYK